MTLRKRLLGVGVLVLFCGAVAAADRYAGIFPPSFMGESSEGDSPAEDYEVGGGSFFKEKEVLQFWYTDDTYTDFFNSAAVAYGELQDRVRIEPKLVPATEYLEEINRASVAGGSPDLYMLGGESLEKAYLAGLAVPVDGGAQIGTEHFPQTAINAVTYHGKVIAYPLSFETSALLYNRSYLAQLGDTAVPGNISEILVFADSYDAPENVESFFKWDVSHIIHNFGFAGDAMHIGGAAGDDASDVDIYNEDTIRNMLVYQNLGQFFSIDVDEASYEKVLQDFIDGKLIFTIATTDAVSRLEDAKLAGTFLFDYGVADVPDPSEDLGGSALSVTNAVVVNGYSTRKKAAADFAQYLTETAAGSLYEKTGVMAADRSVDLSGYAGAEALAGFYQAYEHSVPMPKLMEMSNFWLYFEVALGNIWSGSDVNSELRNLSERIMTQVTGSAYTEEVIETPVIEEMVEEDAGLE